MSLGGSLKSVYYFTQSKQREKAKKRKGETTIFLIFCGICEKLSALCVELF
jgi:hypothetical protein